MLVSVPLEHRIGQRLIIIAITSIVFPDGFIPRQGKRVGARKKKKKKKKIARNLVVLNSCDLK